jgi:alpha-glucosidase
VYVRSFYDSDGDGIGDLPGVTARLDYLKWLGVDTVWLSPVMPSPNVDWGYDVSDYVDVHPELGTLADLDRLIAEAARREIAIMLDLVPNHTSNRHRWFDALPERYVWANEIPNDWKSVFSKGSAWTFDERRQLYYLHQFAPEQPDLDWWNADVRAEFERILRFWFDRGVAGFRIDVAHALIKDRELRNGVRYMRNRPEVHEIYRRWQSIAAEYEPKRILLGETYVGLKQMIRYYGDGTDELDLAMNFALVNAPFDVRKVRPIIEDTLRLLPPGATPLWFGSNHDHSRLATRWAAGDERKALAALFVLLTLPGVAILYQGDELALLNGRVPRDRVRDVARPPRDPERTPLPWTRGGAEWVEPWLPLADTSRNVEDQQADPASTLNAVRALIERRRSFAGAPYRAVASSDTIWAYARGGATCVANLGDKPARHDGIELAAWECRILGI